MDMNVSDEESIPVTAMLPELEQMYRQTAEELVLALKKLRRDPVQGAKEAASAVKELKSTYDWVNDERNRADKLRSRICGTVGERSLDLDAARVEIGRRLACLRDA
jgi:hypothetical protein